MYDDHDMPAVRYRFENGKVQIYVDDNLRLDAPWTGPKPSFPETNSTLKKWADDLIADDSDDHVTATGGTARLVDNGFTQGDDNVWRK